MSLFSNRKFHFHKYLTKPKPKIESILFLIRVSWHSCVLKNNNVQLLPWFQLTPKKKKKKKNLILMVESNIWQPLWLLWMCFDPKESLSKEFEMTIVGKLLIALVSKGNSLGIKGPFN
jgi:hypothetical protein